MSVPAHPSQWNAADVWAGHFRRYRKRELLGLVEENGLELEHVECMGFPPAQITERMQARAIERELKAGGDRRDRQRTHHRSVIKRDDAMRWQPCQIQLPGRIAFHGYSFSNVP